MPTSALPELPTSQAGSAPERPALTPSTFGSAFTVTAPALTPVPGDTAAVPRPTPAPSAASAPAPRPPASSPARAIVARAVAAAAPSGKVKGTLLISRMKYLRARGEHDCERVLRRMSAADQAVLRGMLLPSSWYEANLVVRLEMTTVALLSRGDRKELFLDMGRFTADTNLGPTGVQRPYLRDGDPQFLLRNVPRMYAAQHAGGVRMYEQLEPKAAVIRTVEGDEANADDCLTAVGWLRRAVELAGGRVVTVEEKRCRGRGDACCEYVCRWI